jgi:5-methylcytosine-specific restriction endonuclease McrA
MRNEFSAKVKVAAFERAKGFCEECTAYLYPGKFHFDHIRPAGLLGEPTLKNCRVLCINCHGAKTQDEDLPRIVKAKHQQRAHLGAKRKYNWPKRPMRNWT